LPGLPGLPGSPGSPEPKTAAPRQKTRPARALSVDERQAVLDVLNSERFMNQSPAQVWATLLDEGTNLCSVRTKYRILAENDQVRERRNQARRTPYERPELLATGPNQVWSWDITQLKAAVKGRRYYLYVILDVFSRYVVGWMLAEREDAQLAERLIEQSVQRHSVEPGRLTLHADRGAPMTAKDVASLLDGLGVAKSHSRPSVSNDNPYSESQFKTMKYRPDFPVRFSSIQEARSFCVEFFRWYNEQHRHSGIAHLTPETVHFGRSETVLAARQAVLDRAFASHPERYVHGRPIAEPIPNAVYINKPTTAAAAESTPATSQ
jgi:putative transposase